MNDTSIRSATILTLAIVAATAAAPALAGALEDLRRDGTVGERFDGYAVVRDKGASDEAKKLVAEVNGKRKDIYEKRASEQGVPVEQVGRVYAKKIFEEAPAGTWFLGEDAAWVQKAKE